MNIIFMGTPEFAVPSLEFLYKKGYEISLVITQQDRPKGRGKKLSSPPIKLKAQELGLEVYQPKNINSSDSINKIRELSPDFIVVVAYGQILGEQILKSPKNCCINVHASLLPKYRGAAPINWAIINGEDKTGITIMEISEGLDSGDILMQEKIYIDEIDDAVTIHNKLMNLGANLLVETIENFESIYKSKQPQKDELSTYSPMLEKKMGKIDWNKTSIEIKNLVRGVKPWPGAYTIYNGEKLKIHDIDIYDCNDYQLNKCGEVVKVCDKGIIVKTSDSCIRIKELQLPGKKRMSVEDFLRGNKFKTGIILK